MDAVLSTYKSAIVQIATPYSTGTGFFLKGENMIISNEHVIRNNRQVVIDGAGFTKQLARVLFTDPKYDLAFIEAPDVHKMPTIKLSDVQIPNEGDPIIAAGHPFGLKFSATKGIISSTNQEQDDIMYIQHDAALNPGNSGGPLISANGMVLGVNTFIVRDGQNIGFSLPASYLKTCIRDYRAMGHSIGARCYSCLNTVSSKVDHGEELSYCPHCGASIRLPDQAEDYKPVGVSKTIEDLLISIGYDVRLARRGPNSWEIMQGSARINISYYEKNGLIFGDAYLCSLPKQDIREIYTFLLRQNYQLEGLTFSIKDNDIVLSLLIYDRYLNNETGTRLFKYLFEKADEYDNILVDRFGAKWNIDK